MGCGGLGVTSSAQPAAFTWLPNIAQVANNVPVLIYTQGREYVNIGRSWASAFSWVYDDDDNFDLGSTQFP